MKWSVLGAIVLVLAGALASLVLIQNGRYLPESLKPVLAKWLGQSSIITTETLSEPAAADQLYTWVDKHGVTHYSQEPPAKGPKGNVVIYDGDRVTPLAPVDTELAARTAKAAGSLDKTEEPELGGSETLHELRREIHQKRQKMQQTGAMAHPDL
jgi:hypothetical protein